MDLRFHRDPETGDAHCCAAHGVSESEVQEVLDQPLEDWPGRERARIALGHTEAGRYLQVIYVPDPEPGSVFVVTAYDLGPRARRALRRKLGKR